MNIGIIPEISSFEHLLKKLEYDLERYSKYNHSYVLIDCIMSLNALPEWINNSANIPDELKELARAKELIMKGNNGFELDESQLKFDIDHQLRFVRLFCNHSKHKTDSGQIPKIISTYGAAFPMTLPAKLYNFMAVGSLEFDAEYLLLKVYNYWKENIENLKTR